MRRKNGDDEALRILNGRVVRTSHGPKASIAALQWAADRAGQSYGVFTQHLTPEEEARIQEDYNTFKREQEAAAETRRAARVEETLISEGLIISVEDA